MSGTRLVSLTLYMLNFSEDAYIDMYLHFMSFLQIDMAQVIEILPQVRKELSYSTVSTMGADVLATQGARASATMIIDIDLVKPK